MKILTIFIAASIMTVCFVANAEQMPATSSGCFLPSEQNQDILCNFSGFEAEYLFTQMIDVPISISTITGLPYLYVEKKGKNINCTAEYDKDVDYADVSKARWFECGFKFQSDGTLHPRPTLNDFGK